MAGVPIKITTEDMARYRDRLKIGQKVKFQIEEYDEAANLQKRKIKGWIAEKYPYHVVVEYYQRSRVLRRSIPYTDLYLMGNREETKG